MALGRMQAIKARLISEGRIKHDKTRQNMANEEMTIGLPSGWAWAPLNQLTSVLNGRAYAKDELLEVGTPVLRVGNLFTSKHWYYSNLNLEEAKYCISGDLLFAWSASFGPFIWSGPKAIYHYHIWKLSLHSESDLDKNFLYTFLLAKTQEMKASGHGVSMIHMTKEAMEKIVVPVPPLGEQRRIVARVEELMKLCDALEQSGRLADEQHARLTSTLFDALAASESAHALAENWQRVAEHFDLLLDRPKAVDSFEHVIRQLCVRGILVVQSDEDESASDVVKRTITRRGHGRAPSAEPIAADEVDWELPMTWKWVRLSQIAEMRLGKMLDKAKNRGIERPYLRNTNVQWHRFELDDIKTLRLEDYELSEYRLKNGDLLVCEGGEPGRCAIWNHDDREMYFQKALHRVRPLGGVLAKYLEIHLRQDADAGRLDRYFTGATIKHFAGQELARYVVALPPIAEQHRIVARVEELRSLCADMRHRLIQARETQSRLADALLAEVA